MTEKNTEIRTADFPEFMSAGELSKAFEQLFKIIETKQQSAFENEHELISLAASIYERPERWCMKAVFVSLKHRLKNISPETRDTILSYLFEIMFFGKRSVRSIAAAAYGRITAFYYESAPSIWTDFLRKALFVKKDGAAMEGGVTEDAIKIVLMTVYRNIPDAHRKAVLNSYASYFKSTKWDYWTCLRLISGIFDIPVKEWGSMQRGTIGGFVRAFLKGEDFEVRLASQYLLMQWLYQGWSPSEDFKGYMKKSFADISSRSGADIVPAENFLISEICKKTGIEWDDNSDTSAKDTLLFRENLRTDHSWMHKIVNLKILKGKYEGARFEDKGFASYITHLIILLRLNPDEAVFKQAGEDILFFADSMSEQHKYEVFRELMKAVETDYDSTGYIPEFLGKLSSHMSLKTIEELIPDIQGIAGTSDPESAGEIIEVICSMIRNISFEGKEGENLLSRLCGIFSQSFYEDMPVFVKRVIFTAGYELFGKLEILAHESLVVIARNMLISIKKGDFADPILHSAAVKNTASWLEKYSAAFSEVKRPVAFYSGSFDPFSNGHRAIVREIADMGFQVFVNVHDFALKRNVQPLLLRRQMAAMEVTDIEHVQLFPEEITINADNMKDLKRLLGLFEGRKVWIVAAAERVMENSSYTCAPCADSVHSYPHIVLVRNETYGIFDEDDVRKNLKGEVIALKLPAYYEHMTSWEIRKNIREGKTIEGLVGTRTRHFIEKRNLYADSSTYKRKIATLAIDTENDGNTISIYRADTSNRQKAGYIRYRDISEGSEKTAEIEELTVLAEPEGDYAEILLDEALMELQKSFEKIYCQSYVMEGDMLRRRGFTEDELGDYTARTDRSFALFADTMSCLTDEFAEDKRVAEVCRSNFRRLQRAAAALFPGNLILSINTEIMNYRLIRLISKACSEEGIEKICVPFGKILKHVNIPDVKIMPLNTEKCFDETLNNFSFREKNGYPALSTQLRIINSMDEPFVLVDDLYHKGFRMDKIREALSGESMSEEMLIAGAISGTGVKTAEKDGYNVEAVYEIPKLKLWMIESDMLPFFGGDKVGGNKYSTYPILPYQIPEYFRKASYRSVYNVSKVCLENDIELFKILEEVYREKYNRRLNVARLSEVIDEPGIPETLREMEDIENRRASALLETELIRMKRLTK